MGDSIHRGSCLIGEHIPHLQKFFSLLWVVVTVTSRFEERYEFADENCVL